MSKFRKWKVVMSPEDKKKYLPRNFMHCSPLGAWIEQAQLDDFVENHLKVHLSVYGVSDNVMEDCIRMIMISLRQELQK